MRQRVKTFAALLIMCLVCIKVTSQRKPESSVEERQARRSVLRCLFESDLVGAVALILWHNTYPLIHSSAAERESERWRPLEARQLHCASPNVNNIRFGPLKDFVILLLPSKFDPVKASFHWALVVTLNLLSTVKLPKRTTGNDRWVKEQLSLSRESREGPEWWRWEEQMEVQLWTFFCLQWHVVCSTALPSGQNCFVSL